MHLDCEPLATRAFENREDAFFLNSRWHTDKWSRATVVTMSDTGIRNSPSKPGLKQQGMEFLMLHLLAAASYEETDTKQDDIPAKSPPGTRRM